MRAANLPPRGATELLMTVLLDPSADGLSPDYIKQRCDGIVHCVRALLAAANYEGALSSRVNKSARHWCVELCVERGLIKQLDLFDEQPRILSAETARSEMVSNTLLVLRKLRRATDGVSASSIEQLVRTLPRPVQDVYAALKSLPDNTLPIRSNYGDFQLSLQTSNGRELDSGEHLLCGCIVAAGPMELAFCPLRKRSRKNLCTQPVRVLIPYDIRAQMDLHAVLDKYVMTNLQVQLTVLSEKAIMSRRQQTKVLIKWPPVA